MWRNLARRYFTTSTECFNCANTTKLPKGVEGASQKSPSKLSQTIYFSQIPYDTKKEDIAKIFEGYGPIEDLHLPMTTGKEHVKGYGRIVLSDPKNTKRAVIQMQGYVLQNRKIKLTLGTEFIKKTKSKYDVVIIRNLPYNIIEEELMKILQPYQVLRVGLAKSPIRQECLGYGYARFASLEASGNALNQLKNLQIKGRKLRMSYAEPNEHGYKYIV